METNAVVKTLSDLQQRGGLRGADVANLSDVSRATVSRWSTGKASPTIKTQLILSDLRYVIDRLAEFYTPDETRMWLYSRHELLDGKSAMELIHEGDTDRVLSTIEQLATLSYA